MADLLVIGDVVITMDRTRRMIADGAVAIRGDRILAVGTRAELAPTLPAATVVGGPGCLVLPGLVNAHQHLTGDRLVRSAIPDDITSHEAIFSACRAAPAADDDELSATRRSSTPS